MTGSKNIALSVRNLTKEYPFQDGVLKVLDDISFNLYEGEILGVIGRNGAGKSTLLKVLSEITSPTNGTIEYEGRLTSIIEIGTGFHADLSGKENVFLSASILGHSRSKTKAMYDSIVEFSGLDGFMDTPVKHYSSGMFLRLAFSVAFHMEVDILLLDEVLAVGDLDFRNKCYDKLRELRSNDVSIIIVNHNMNSILEFADRTMYLESGKIKGIGETMSIVQLYQKNVYDKNERIGNDGKSELLQFENDILKISDFKIVNSTSSGQEIYPDHDIGISIQLEKKTNDGSVEIGLAIKDSAEHRIFIDSYALRKNFEIENWEKGEYLISTTIPKNLLNRGTYSVDIILSTNNELIKEFGQVELFSILPFSNDPRDKGISTIIRPQLTWDIKYNIDV